MALNCVHLLFQVASFKLLIDMVWFKFFKNFAMASYIIRWIMLAVQFLTFFWQKEETSDEDTLNWVVKMFKAMWAL